MKNRILSLGICFLYSSMIPLFAQEAPMKFGKVSAEELQMRVYEPDTTASALVLGDYGTLAFRYEGDKMVTYLTRHTRLKILKRAGFEYGDISIPFYSKNRTEQVFSLKAEIFQPDGSKRALSKQDFFEEQVSENVTRIKFTFPEIQEGSIIEYQYQHSDENFFTLPEWYFQGEVPVLWSEYRLDVPQFYSYVVLTQGAQPEIAESPKSAERFLWGNDMLDNVEVTHYRYRMSNVPALREEGFITTMDDYLARIRFQLASVNFNSIRRPVMSSWQKVAEELNEHPFFGYQLKRKGVLNKIKSGLDPLLAGTEDPEARIRIIYDFVNKNYTWDGRYSFLFSEGMDKIDDRKQGTSGDLNLLLVALLQSYDLEAYPMLVSTRGNGRPVDLYPILDQFNHVIVYVSLGDRYLLLDAGNNHRPVGLLRISALNQQGWLVNPANPIWIPIVPQTSKSVQFFHLDIDPETGSLAGSLSASFEGYEAVDFRDELLESTGVRKVAEDVVAKEAPIINYSEVEVTGLEDLYQPIRYKATVGIPEGVSVAGDLIYLQPVILPNFSENPFKQIQRSYPVDIPHPMEFKYILNVALPPGYSLESQPENINLVLPDNQGRFLFQSRLTDKFLQITSTIQLQKLHWEAAEYAGIKQFFNLLIEKQQEPVVLKKMN
ncbi:MAG: DUF3857 domain-containing protein [Lewinellaceae bacterium]|nr:DUF3857 domain-containing protein [Lewinellaceae bacterium]